VTVNGNVIAWRKGMTVKNILDEMKYSFRLLIIKVNGEIVKRENWDDFPVPKDADIKVIHLMSGG